MPVILILHILVLSAYPFSLQKRAITETTVSAHTVTFEIQSRQPKPVIEAPLSKLRGTFDPLLSVFFIPDYPAASRGECARRIQLNCNGMTVETRIPVPPGYQRVPPDKRSFGYYLRNLPLKPDGTPVHYYNGEVKPQDHIYVAVVDKPIGTRDLHQCADAVMRLRAEYLYSQKRYNDIHFNFTNGFRADYFRWMTGKRIRVNGNNVRWTDAGQSSNTPRDLWNYLRVVFAYAGSLSLSKELVPVKLFAMQPGDVFIRGGSPGHAVIVVDMAYNPGTGKKVYMLAQSYMPAQEIQILANPAEEEISPWYTLREGENIQTPEWNFTACQLMRFPE